MPICEKSVCAGVVRRQVAGRVPAGRVPLVVQDLRGRHVYVLPIRTAEPVSQVDVLHVHEIALVEATDLVERGLAQQKARTRQPSDGAFAGLESLLAVGRRPRVRLPQRTHYGVHAAADEARLMT